MQNNRRKKTPPAETLVSVLKYILLGLVVLAVLIPIYPIIMGSLKTVDNFRASNAFSLPTVWMWKNYADAFIDGGMAIGFLNTLLVLAASLIIAILCGSMTAYVLSRFEFVGKKAVKAAFLLVSLIPSITTQVITYRIVNALGLVDNLLAPILMFGGTDILAVYIFLQFLDSISVSLDESARLDGANSYTVFFKILLPLLKPAIATVLIIKFVGVYNEFYIPFIYAPNVHLVSTALYSFTSSFGTRWEIICAGQIIIILPMFVIFLAAQKFIYSGLAAGSVKG
ncbi:sugar ABC transporter permease [Spirochaetia bacterium]|nr:sugar ABC transporter permease [Spirochaetia bacterium]